MGIDGIGYAKNGDTESQVLFELIAYYDERSSLLITSNQATFSEWESIFGDNMMFVVGIGNQAHHTDIYKI
ncbi:MAG: ATP-binding protein [Psychromonas sp.]|nr:ATP-binding protein [Psychromonas sp.]